MRDDLARALRSLLCERRFSAAIVLILSLTTAANLAVFALLNGILAQPLPYRDPGALVRIFEVNPSKGIERSPVSDGTFLDWRRDLRSFDDIEAFMPRTRDTIVQIDRDPEVAREALATAGFLAVLGVPPQLGSGKGIRLSDRYWRRRFAGEASAIGRKIVFEGFAQHPVTIAAVMPPAVDLPEGADFWGTIVPAPGRARRNLDIVGRLTHGVSLAQAQAEMDAMSRRLAEAFPAENAGWHAVIVPLKDTIVAPARTPLVLLYTSVSLLLLIAAINVAVLFSTRRVRRARELSIHLALGAGRARLLRQSLAQCAALSAVSAICGTLLASWLLHVFVTAAPASIPRLAEVHLSGSVLGAAAGLALALAMLMWAVSAGAARVSFEALRSSGTRATGSSGAATARSWMVRLEVACCACLLLVAAATVRGFVALERAQLGFNPSHVLLVDVRQPIMKAGEHVRHYPTQRFVQTAERVTAYASTLPGVAGAGIATSAPVAAPPFRAVYRVLAHAAIGPLPPDGSVTVDGPDARPVATRIVDGGFFRTSEIPLLVGRAFTRADRLDALQIDDFDADRGAGAAIVSAAFAKRYGTIASIIGRYLEVNLASYRSVQIVGVAADVVSTPGQAPVPLLYLPYAQAPFDRFTLLVRAQAPDPVARQLSQYLRTSVGTDVSAFNVRSYGDVVSAALAIPRFSSEVMTGFGTAATALTAVALYTVLAFVIALRRRELAIRIALGADPMALLRRVLRDGLLLALAGAVAGIAAGVLLIRAFAAVLPELPGASIVDASVTGALMLIVGAVASYRPASSAAHVDPLPLLKSE
ncbi:MAG TPA: ABC transporter permease [Vicinamibacterales bacterium]|nr:ABC transporter permease [Vicinamibacterales bacterium]